MSPQVVSGRPDGADAFLDAIIDHLPVAVYCKDAIERRFRVWNRAAEQLYGRSRADVLGHTDEDIFPALQAAAFRAKDDAVLAGQVHGDVPEEPVTAPDGSTVWLHTYKATIPAKNGNPMMIVGISEDITGRRRTDMRVRAARTEAENLLSVISTILIQVDDQDRVQRYNAAAERLFGIQASAVIGRRLEESGLRLDWGDILPLIITTLADQTTHELHDLRCTRPDGAEVFLDLYIIAAPTSGDGGRSSVLLLGHDVTRRREQEVQRAQGQKLESIGQLAAGIAHEINTPIQFIGDNLRFLADAFRDLARHRDAVATCLASPGDGVAAEAVQRIAEDIDLEFLHEEIPKAIDQSLEGVNRVADIVRAMKAFSHPDGDGGVRQVDLNAALRTTCTVARNEYKYVADLDLDLDPVLPTVPGHEGELNQVFLNLLVNAAHAIGSAHQGSERRGTIRITSRSLDDAVELRFADTGQGIKTEHRARIFTPFFTTKPVGKGTGQGLALCHSIIVRKHGGGITFDSEVGKGTTFIIRLPTQRLVQPA